MIVTPFPPAEWEHKKRGLKLSIVTGASSQQRGPAKTNSPPSDPLSLMGDRRLTLTLRLFLSPGTSSFRIIPWPRQSLAGLIRIFHVL
jgi:hypothetical protein